MRTSKLALGCALSVALALTGCAGREHGSPEKVDAPVRHKVLNEAELTRALLTEQNVGEGFEAEEYGWNVNADGWPGCLRSLNGITWFAAPTREVQVGIYPDGDTSRFPFVLSSAAAFSTDAEAGSALDALREKLAGCTRADGASDGIRFAFRVTQDAEHRADQADDEVNVTARGSMRAGGRTVLLSFDFSVVRVRNNVVLAGYLTSSSDPVTSEATLVVEAAVARLVAVAAGKAVPGTSLDFEPFVPGSGGGTEI